MHYWSENHRLQVTELANALGIENVESVIGFTLRVHADEVSRLTVVRAVSNAQIESAAFVMRGYGEEPLQRIDEP